MHEELQRIEPHDDEENDREERDRRARSATHWCRNSRIVELAHAHRDVADASAPRNRRVEPEQSVEQLSAPSSTSIFWLVSE